MNADELVAEAARLADAVVVAALVASDLDGLGELERAQIKGALSDIKKAIKDVDGSDRARLALVLVTHRDTDMDRAELARRSIPRGTRPAPDRHALDSGSLQLPLDAYPQLLLGPLQQVLRPVLTHPQSRGDGRS